MKTSELQGAALDWAVAKAEGKDNDCEIHAGNVLYGRATSGFTHYNPSADWSQGGPIIEREGIALYLYGPDKWNAMTEKEYQGPTPLIAAMRCLVASKLGDDIELPRN